MARTWSSLIVTLAATVLAGSHLAISQVTQDSSRLIAMENAWNQAELHNDAVALRLLLADDFVMTVSEGDTLDKGAMIASVKHQSYKPTLLQSSNMAVRIHGSTAVITGLYHEKGTDKGKPYDRRGRFTDTWIYEQGRWQCLASHFTATKD